MGDQDWTPVVIKKTPKQKVAGLSSAQALTHGKIAGSIATEKRFGAAENKTATPANAKKLEESTEDFTHKTVDKNLARAIVQARSAKKLTQVQLANLINERPQIIQQYESGAAIPNAQVINKLDRALGIHLPRGK